MQLKGQADLRDIQIHDGKFCLLSRLSNNRVRARISICADIPSGNAAFDAVSCVAFLTSV
jgi:hypothetical protein